MDGLLNAMSDDFILMERKRLPDGEGGFTTTYAETEVVLSIAVAHKTTIEGRKAEQEGTASTYTFFPVKGVQLVYNDVLKRVKDDQTFRITSNTGDKKSPEFSDIKREYVTAEKWVIPA